MANYSKQSIYYGVKKEYKSGLSYLDFNILKSFTSDASDYEFTITAKYHHRPDLLSYELYGSPFFNLIFSLRNPDLLGDPIYDFTSGKTIMIPTAERVRLWSK
jgi:hypothetical protein